MLSRYSPFFALLAYLGMASDALAADIVLRQKVTPVKSVIALGDIADILQADAALAQRLALTPLWVAPPLGEKRFVTPQQVREVLVSRGYRAADLNLTGADKVQVGWDTQPRGELAPTTPDPYAPGPIATNSMGFRVIPSGGLPAAEPPTKRSPTFITAAQEQQLADQLTERIVAYIEDQTGKYGSVEVEFDLERRHSELLLQGTGELTVAGGRAPWFGRQRFKIQFDTESGPTDLSLSVDAYDTTPVLVARRGIPRGALITAADVSLDSPSRDARLPNSHTPVRRLDAVLGHEAARAFREGDIVTHETCLAPLMFSRNEIVEVVSAAGGISIKRQVKALSDARLGDVVEVELLGTRNRLVARVVGPRQLATLGSGLESRSPIHPSATAAYR